MFKKLILLFFVSIFVSSCWDSSEWIWSSFKDFENSDFKISIPSSWEVIEDKENILPKARRWEIELAVTSSDFNSWFANNMLILSEELDKITTAKEYSMLNNVGASADYVDYKKLATRDISFADGTDSLVYEFEARYNKDTPKLQFIQTANICNTNKAFFITVALNSSVDDLQRYEEFINTFECK